MFWCTKCVTPSTRPRVQFNEHGVCNACTWHDKKQSIIDWHEREQKLSELCDMFRKPSGFDVIVPCSGGKDGSYVAWRLKHDLGMHPLCITLRPQMQTPIGRQNLENFISSGFDHLMISPNPSVYKQFAKKAFIERGMPKQPFVTGISTALFQIAERFEIPFLIYGEHGESEYGGAQETAKFEKMNRDFLVNIYYEGEDPASYGSWWVLPGQKALSRIYATWWSYFEDWEPQKHAKLAKEKCGLEMLVGGSIGTFTNYSQLDDVLQDLHGYLMFVKFGFGRCTSDASIEIRRGRMTRDQGVEVVRKLDGIFPVEYLPAYLSYFEMSEGEFWGVIDKFANKSLLAKTGMVERPYILKQEVE